LIGLDLSQQRHCHNPWMPITPRIFGDRGRKRASALGIDPERLPPGQSPTVKWPVLTVGAQPDVDRSSWRVSVDGAVEAPFVLDYDALMAEPQLEWTGDIHCVTRWSKFGMRWRGVSAAALIERARPAPAASHLLAHSYGGYTTNLPLSDVTDHPALIAHEADGAPLTGEHGGPVRLLVPHLYLWKSAKWIKRLELLDADQLGFWELGGYHHRGDPWLQERYSVDSYVAQAKVRELRRASRS
jgi:DMSO/TMAO reductase YedYZ molybdopterin-dependent catalytic subunit